MVPPEKEPWKCFHCRKINKFSANYCPKCSRPWQEVIDRSYVDPRNVPPQGSRPKSPRRQGYAYSTEQEYEEPWHYQPWPRSPRKRTQSPRQRAPRAQSQGRGGKGKGQSSGKGQSAYYQDAGPNQFPSAPAVPKASSWMQMVPSPAAATATPPPPPPAGPALDPVKMKELFNLVDKRQDQLTPEIQAKMQEMKVDEVKVERAHMHHAVDHHGDAKQELAAAHQARGNIHSSWIAFLSASMQQWKEFADQFAAQEKLAVERITAAQAKYQKACELLSLEKQKIGINPGDVAVISDEEQDTKEISMLNANQITEGMQHLSTTLASLHSSAEALAAQEHAAKRPRIEEVIDTPDAPMGSERKAKALEPFGGAN